MKPLRFRAISNRIAGGLVLGGLTGFALDGLGLGAAVGGFTPVLLLASLVGVLVYVSRFRTWLLAFDGALLAAIVLIAYTPISGHLLEGIQRSDKPVKVDAIVVLACGYVNDQTISARSQDRLLEAMTLLHLGYSDRLLLTRASDDNGNWAELARKEMRNLGLDFTVEETNRVVDTHDEALAVSQIARRQGWKRIMLVTHAWHMRRAAASFESAGCSVVCIPCNDSTYNMLNPDSPRERLSAFRDWLHEEIGFQWYRCRGWI